MKYSLGISNFLEEICSLSHSIIFLYFFALITEDGFLISLCYSLELCIQMGISFLSPLPFDSLLFTVICKASLDNHFAFLHFFFLGMVLIPASCTMSQTSVHSSSGTLSDLINRSLDRYFQEVISWPQSLHLLISVCVGHSAVSDFLQPHGLSPTRIFCPWDSPGKNMGWVVIPPSRGSSQQGSNQGLLHCRQILYCLSH